MVTADCKGVPLVSLPPAAGRGDRHPPANPGEPQLWQGREGEQEEDGGVGRRRAIEPFVRTADDVIEEVMRKKAQQ